ncbi:beta-ketoacyl-[acyl-carrier-protein] synthase family protein [Actinoplanes sp. NPDC048791]|uniref:beta-ketoacyl-[acyl-carrier-protein] synthase family protein n=1 Tax=Actinoplanes sp. NPDC048791 TaxID=3154623 RepID=UPI0033FD4B28
MTADRVVVTGMGPVSSIGVGLERFHEAALKSVSGIRPITSFDPSRLSVRIAGEVDLPESLAPSGRDRLADDRCTHLGMAATRLAVDDSGLDLTAEADGRVAVVIGTGIGGIGTWESNTRAVIERGERAMRPRFIPMAMLNALSARISLEYGLHGSVLTMVSACASGPDAIACAAMLIRSGEADVVIAGGADAPVVETIVGGFARMRALSVSDGDPARASRPFHTDRDGFVIAEGAGVLVLESLDHARRRQARIHAELTGYGRSSDAFHATMPQPDGSGARRAITSALRSAGLAAEDVAHVNSHGTGTPFNDAAETIALHSALGAAAPEIPVTANKSITGHCLGASGALEAIASIQAITSGLIPPIANLDRPDKQLHLDLVRDEPREADVHSVLTNSFAFGGHNVALVFGRMS